MHINLKKYVYFFLLISCLPLTTWAFDSFDCVGTEPFWKLSLSEKSFAFTESSNPSTKMPVTQPQSAENMNLEHIRIFRTTMQNQKVVIVIQKQSCTDGMSDDIYAYEGLFITKDKVFHGCCSKKLILSN